MSFKKSDNANGGGKNDFADPNFNEVQPPVVAKKNEVRQPIS